MTNENRENVEDIFGEPVEPQPEAEAGDGGDVEDVNAEPAGTPPEVVEGDTLPFEDEGPEPIVADLSKRVVRDITARVQTANELYPKARVQVREDGVGALFVPSQPNEPLLVL